MDIDKPLRGWKSICEFIGVASINTAKAILEKKHLLHREGVSIVLLPSEYLKTLRPETRRYHLRQLAGKNK